MPMTEVGQFRDVYETSGVYESRLLAHYYDGVDELELVARLLTRHHGKPTGSQSVVELGCGTGRLTACLEPYARRLIAVDSSRFMIDAMRSRFPQVDARCADTRDAVTRLLGENHTFDVVAAFWSLSYPLGEYFETMTADGIQPVGDPAQARDQAADFVRSLVKLLAPGGHLLALFFDADTPEQQLVTRSWERIAPFPEEGRNYTLNLLVGGLRRAEDDGHGTLTHSRYGGTAWASDRDAAMAWFNVVHFNNVPALINDPVVQREVANFVERYEQPSNGVTLPSGVHLIDFHAVPHPTCHLRESPR